MLSNACPPVRCWAKSGTLAFTPPRSFNTKEEHPRAALSSVSPDQHVRNGILQRKGGGLHHGCSSAQRIEEARGRPRALPCLRGGGEADDAVVGDNEAREAASSAQDPSSVCSSSSSPVYAAPHAGVYDQAEGSPTIREESNTAHDITPVSTVSRTAAGAAIAVSLVTERSTATGGGRGRVSYDVLADGTLHVDVRQRRRPRSSTPATLVSHDDAVQSSTSQRPAPYSGSVEGTSVRPASGHEVSTSPASRLEGLRKCCQKLVSGAGKAAAAAAGEAKAFACGAGQQAMRAAVVVRGGLMNTFLPAGYPASVRPEYLKYRCWDIVQDLSSHLRGVLATQAVLEGMGVGRAGSTPLAATLQWMARDGASMIGGLLFTSVASANFGVNIKTWRLFADASNDVGLALEMLAPLPAFRSGGRFLRLICLASVFKAACGVAGGATGAAITEHWAVDNNIADIGAKNGAQHTVASLLGLGLSVWFARAVSDAGSASGTRVWSWYLALTVMHLLANYAAMRTLALRSLNPSRASLLMSEYLHQTLASFGTDGHDSVGPEDAVGDEEGEESRDWMGRTPESFAARVLSPSAAAKRERMFLLPGWLRALKPWGDLLQINVGVRVRSLVREADDLLWLTSLYHDERAMVGVQVSYQPLGPRMGMKVNLALREDASADDRLQAMFQANVIHYLLARDPDSIPQGGDGVDRTLFLRKVTEEALRLTRKHFPAFRKALLHEGWDLSRVTLGGGPWVGRWGSLAKDD